MFPHERSLVQRFEGKPFVLLGVDVGDDREVVQRQEQDRTITWRSFWDQSGDVSRQWKAETFPTILLIDHKGVIRQRYAGAPPGETLDRAIDQLVREAEKDGATPVTASTTSRATRLPPAAARP
jgi:hypothetical protein